MKRFYCTRCERVKRVRKLPTTRHNPLRRFPEGECLYHSGQHPGRHAKTMRVTKKASVAAPVATPKKQRRSA